MPIRPCRTVERPRPRFTNAARALAALPVVLAMLGCQTQSGAGGAGGDDGPPVAVSNELMGTLVPGTVEAGGGYLIGAAPDRLGGESRDRRLARRAVEQARQNPATADDARTASSPDLNHDGFITTDELIALARFDLAADELLDRLETTGYVFELSPDQQDRLLSHGVDRAVVAELPRLNRSARQRLRRERSDYR